MSSSTFLSVINSSSGNGVQFLGITGAQGIAGIAGARGLTGAQGLAGPVSTSIPPTVTSATTFTASTTLNQIVEIVSTGTAVVIDASNNLRVDYSANGIYVINAPAGASNIALYVSNVPSTLDRTYTLSLILNRPICARTLFVNNVDSAAGSYLAQTMICASGLANVVIPNTSTYVVQKLSILKSSSATIGNVFITDVTSLV
jgi:hypothetical protein